MKFESNKSSVFTQITTGMIHKLERIGELVLGDAVILAPVDLGFLRGQGSYRVVEDGVRIAFNAEYAAIQEFGGEIKPVHKKNLAIPIDDSAKHKSPGEFNNLFIIVAKEHLYLAMDQPNGEPRFMFLLVKRVYMPAHPYLRPAVHENFNNILRILAA